MPREPSHGSGGEPAVHRLDRLSRAFESLPDELRLIVGLHYQEQCSFAEIAAIVELSEADVRDAFRRALQRLGEVAA